MDWQRNDCVGRKRRHQFQHRRQILRCCTESDTHANTFSDPNSDSYAHCNCNSNAHGYRELHAHAEVCADSETSPDARTASVVRRSIKTVWS
jgi:hypothetical protein